MGAANSRQEMFWEACCYGKPHSASFLLRSGTIDVNWVSSTHNSCPIHAAANGKLEVVKLLLNNSVNVGVKDSSERVPMHIAAMGGHRHICELLHSAGSPIDVQDISGWTPLISASYWGHASTVDLLCSIGCNVSLRNKNGRTALHEVCRSTNRNGTQLVPIVDLLHKYGANLNEQCIAHSDAYADFSPLMYAVYHGHLNLVRRLVELGCDLNLQTKLGWSALHWAVERNHRSIASYLIVKGADTSLETFREETAVDRALDDQMRDLFFMDHDELELVLCESTENGTAESSDDGGVGGDSGVVVIENGRCPTSDEVQVDSVDHEGKVID